jgi:hypothetical protein
MAMSRCSDVQCPHACVVNPLLPPLVSAGMAQANVKSRSLTGSHLAHIVMPAYMHYGYTTKDLL